MKINRFLFLTVLSNLLVLIKNEAISHCKLPALWNHGKLESDQPNRDGKINPGGTATLICDPGYKLVGSSSAIIRCSVNDGAGYWVPVPEDLGCQPICYLKDLQSIPHSSQSGFSAAQTVDVGQNVTFKCISPWYPNFLNEWWLTSTTVKCEGSNKWQYNGEIKCSARCKLFCMNGGTCFQHPLDWYDRCACPIGFTGILCETQLTGGLHTNELLEIKDQTALLSTVADMEPYITAQISCAERFAMRVPSNEFIVKCSSAGKSCPPIKHNDFTHMGSCYTINYDPKNATIVTLAGRRQGLRLILFNNETEFLGLTLQNGIKLIIHKQGERVFPENQGRFLAPGFQLLIPITYVETKREESKCASEEFLKTVDYFYEDEYTVEGCLKTCYQKKVIAKCGCGDPRAGLDPKNKEVSYCTVKERDCVNSVSEVTSDCKCPEQCSISLYEPTYSSAKWPAKNYRAPYCEQIVQESIWKEEDLRRCNEACRNLHLKIDIYYKDLSYVVWTEYRAYTLANLWSDFGNIFDLFFGVGYMWYFEIAVFLWHLFFITIGIKIIMYCRRFFANDVNPA